MRRFENFGNGKNCDLREKTKEKYFPYVSAKLKAFDFFLRLFNLWWKTFDLGFESNVNYSAYI